MTKNIMIVGVGGQGSLLASRIIGNAAMLAGKTVKLSEVHGMSQRGGSVVTYVKYGDEVASPVICRGEADIIISFEQLEAARWIPYLKIGGKVVTNTQKILPMPVITGAKEYPSDIISAIQSVNVDLVAVDTLALATQAGNPKTANVVLIGLAASYLGLPLDLVRRSVEEMVPEKFKEANLKAFDLGNTFSKE